MIDAARIAFPVVVSGPSGVGKTTLCHGLLEHDSGLAFSVSATTRRARSTEVHTRDYFFISAQEFETMKARGEFAEWAEVHGELYGTPKRWLDENISKGLSVLLDIDVQGGVQIMKAYPAGVSIFVMPPSFEELESRLRNRKSDSEEAVKQRLRNAVEEMEYVTQYTYIVVNDTVSRAVSVMDDILAAERSKRHRILDRATWRDLLGMKER